MKTQTNLLPLQKEDARSVLDEIIREGARHMLQLAIEAEVAAYIEAHQHLRDEEGHRLVVRNGHQRERQMLTGAGPLPVKKPRVHDRREGYRFTSAILPRYMRRSPSIDALIPVRYLKGVSTGDFTEALTAILGEGAAGLSATNIVRLKEVWQEEYRAWSQRDLSGKHYVYMWADGIHFDVRLTPDRPCLLVVMGATAEGKKELVGLLDGERESKISWKELLLDLKRRGLNVGSELAIGDGALGFWPALEEVFPQTRHQRCWVHKTANVPWVSCRSRFRAQPRRSCTRSTWPRHARKRSKPWMISKRSSRRSTRRRRTACARTRRCCSRSMTSRQRTGSICVRRIRSNRRLRRCGTGRVRRRAAALGRRRLRWSSVLGREAEKRWRKLDGSTHIVKVLDGVRYEDGEEVPRRAA